ncbi:MAG: histidine kinase [Cytophagaceae bacterium]|jgi:hypothetical protein|nr:histidine kinase [Cytophagaceae bacterium]
MKCEKIIQFILPIFLLTGLLPLLAEDTEVIHLRSRSYEYFIGREFAKVYIDSSNTKSIGEVRGSNVFRRFTEQNLVSASSDYAYWITFYLCADLSESIQIELFDFDIGEAQLWVYKGTQLHYKQETGFYKAFDTRSVFHKNLNFELPVPAGDTLEVIMRFNSQQPNVLKPAIRSTNRMFEYALSEYLGLGVFYGFIILIIIFNFIYFLILRNIYFLYYVLFVLATSMYLATRNGMAFQYLWPECSGCNVYMDGILLTAGMFFMLLFSYSYLDLRNKNKRLAIVMLLLLPIQVLTGILHTFYNHSISNLILNFSWIQLAFVAGIIQYACGYKEVKWYIGAFSVLDIAFLISLLEYLGWIPSGVVSVYALNAGVVMQFVLISVGLAESIRNSYKEKNEALSKLVEALHRTESMRLIELKRQMNPHFIFNGLNSVLHRIRTSSQDEAAGFLVRFSRLVRKILDSSDKLFVSLQEDIELVDLYVKIESVRLGKYFEYQLQIQNSVNPLAIQIPTFILQPLVENAIWHGLMPKEGTRKLLINIHQVESVLIIEVEDNGVGYQRSMALKNATLHTSKGLEILKERLDLLSVRYQKRYTVTIQEIQSEGEVAGTKVILEFEI